MSQNEFRLLKWLAAFVVAALLAGFGVLFKQMIDVRIAVVNLRAEMIRGVGVLDEHLGRIETCLDIVEGGLTRLEEQGDRTGAVE